MRSFLFVYLPLYLRGFAIFLIFASPVWAALNFHDALCYADGLEKYIDYEQTLSDPSGARHYRDVDRYAIIIIGTQIVLFFC